VKPDEVVAAGAVEVHQPVLPGLAVGGAGRGVVREQQEETFFLSQVFQLVEHGVWCCQGRDDRG
jgi:hypothetical protein